MIYIAVVYGFARTILIRQT